MGLKTAAAHKIPWTLRAALTPSIAFSDAPICSLLPQSNPREPDVEKALIESHLRLPLSSECGSPPSDGLSAVSRVQRSREPTPQKQPNLRQLHPAFTRTGTCSGQRFPSTPGACAP